MERTSLTACSKHSDGWGVHSFKRGAHPGEHDGAMGSAAAAAIVVADTTGTITSWNHDAELLLGHRAADAIGRSLDLIVPSAYREAHWAGFRRAMETGECRLDRAATNLPVVHADGGERLLPARFVFLTDARDQPVGAMAIYAEPAGGEEVWGPIVANDNP
jgi:PAS domain S-box-containing protein